MARRAKGPTPEELIEKLQADFDAWKEESTEKVEEVRKEGQEQLESLKQEYEGKLEAVKEEQARGQKEYEARLVEVKEEQENQWGELRVEIVTQLTSLKEDIATHVNETEEQSKVEAERVDKQLKDTGLQLVLMVTYSNTGATVETLEDRMNSALAELRSRMEADSAEATAGTEAIRQAGPTPIIWCQGGDG